LSTKSRSGDLLQFHVVKFDRREEAAAFLAAVSRVLNSPRVDTPALQHVEVWADGASSPGMRLLLTDAALEAAESAFSPVPVGGVVSRQSAPPNSQLIIKGGVTPAWGLADAEIQLSEITDTCNG
jgi:hypothetical protein